MKIIVLTKNYGNGFTGATSSTFALIDQWLAYGIDVEVCTLNIVGAVNERAVIHCFSGKQKLFRYLKGVENKQIVGYSDDHLGFIFRFYGIKYIHTYHGNWPIAMFHTGLKGVIQGIWFIPQYIATIYFSRFVCNVSYFMQAYTKRINSSTCVIRNGIEISTKKCIKQKMQIKKGNLKILMVGGVDQRKYGKLVNILERFSEPFSSKIHIDIYGAIHDKRLTEKILELSAVEIIGFVDNIPYDQYDLLLSTSMVENLSIATVEALCSGVPVIGFKVGGVSEIIGNKRNGYLADCFDCNQIANTIVCILTQGINIDFDNLTIIKDFSWNTAGQNYYELFKAVMK